MRWSGFLVGGIVGIAAAAYMAKRRPGMFALASSAANEAWSGMKGSAVGAVMNRKFGDAAASAGHHAAHQSGEAWGQIEKLVNSDPAVKKQANEIMSEAGTH
ncbi:hypothetical protein [Paenibacillus humicola]|uniref:hypothetical protein n=1 Tax=Paenibacillus humicola TaxID=3110540 RepID=UPI00237AB101|nr:hypothetical protein [Paenibacillus humicola]